MEAPHQAASKEGSFRTRNSRRKEKSHSSTRSDCGELDPVANPPVLRRSARLLSKQQELLKKEQESLAHSSPLSRELSSGIQQQFSIKNSRSRLQSTSSVASSPASSVLGENTSTAFPETTLPRKGRQHSLLYSPEQCNKKFWRTSERGKRKEEALSSETSSKELHLEATDSEKHCDSTSLKQNSGQRSSSSVKSPERKITGKRTRSSNSDTHSPPIKRKKTSSNSETKNTASSSSRKRPRRKVDTQENIDSGSSGPETSSKRAKGQSKASAVAATKNTSVSSVKAVKRKSRSRTKAKKGEETAVSDSDSSPTRHSSTKRRSQGKGKSKLQPSDTEPVSKQTQPPKDRTEGISVPTNHFYSLPPFPEFARLAMASEGNKDQTVPPSEPKASGSKSGKETKSGGVPPSGSMGGGAPPGLGPSSSSSSSEPSPFDPFAAAASEDSRRLQAMMEARGLPPHLLGSLGSKMHYILHKSFSSSMSSSNNSRAQQLLTGIEAVDDEGQQLQSCIEMGQLLVMGNEDTLSGFPVKQAVPALIKLLGMEHNFDMMLNACRSLTYMMEALPRSTAVVANAIPMLIEKLQIIQCMDVAEQALSALELLSRRHGKAILQAGGLGSCLLYLDFFSIAPQRNALSIAASCCQSVAEDDFPLVVDALPVLTGRLQQQDKRSVESCCLCFSRLVENFFSSPTILQQIASQGLLPNLQQLLVVSPPVISSSTFVTVMRMLSNLCAACPPLAVDLLRLNMAETLRYLLVGSGEITENLELTSRSPNEVYEILSLAGELMPPLPKGGVFEVEEIISSKRHTSTTIQWEWQDNEHEWRPYGKVENRIIEMAHMTHEEESAIDLNGNSYIIDFSAMQQINEDTGTTRSIRRTVVNIASSVTAARKDKPVEEDTRLVAMREDPTLETVFVQALFGPLYEVFNSMAGPAIRNKCMKTILKILYHTDADILSEILKDISVSSHLATMLKAQDYRVVVGAIQMAEILMQKLPDIFNIYFHREGVMYQLKVLKDHPLKALATPKPEVATPPLPPVPVPVPPTTETPTSTRKRLSDIFRKGKRHFRRNFRNRSDDQEANPGPSQATPPTARSTTERKPPSSEGITSTDGGSTVVPKPTEASSSSAAKTTGDSSKDRIQHWIHQQISGFLQKWEGSANQNPALNVVNKLVDASQELDPGSVSCLSAVGVVCGILVDSSSNVSAFEFMHCKLHSKLLRYLTLDSADCAVPLNARLRQFLHIFVGLPEQDALLADWTPSSQLGMVSLLQKLHGCVNQLEQFPVKVHDLPGRRGSQALRFLNTHHIKCSLERYPLAVNTSQWKGGPLRIDPLATVQTLERYMMIRGFGRNEHGSRRLEEFDSEDNEVDDTMLQSLTGQGADKHFVEFLINDRVLPYNMTIFQAIRQFATAGLHQESEEELMSLGRPEIWIRTHTVHYRSLSSEASGAGPSSSRGSASLPTTPFSSASASSSSSASRKHAWSGSSAGARKRAASAKLPPPISGATPRVTRSTSARAASGASVSSSPLSHAVKRSSTGGAAGGNGGAEATPLPTLAPPTQSETVKEKEQVKLSPLHQALVDCVKTRPVMEDPSMPIIRLIHALYILNTHWTDLYPGLAGNPIVPLNEFINNKLTAKATRQLQDPLNVMTGNFPVWLQNLATKCPFLFPFDCRQSLFYLTTFDRDRAVARLQEQQPELSNVDTTQTVGPRFDRKKRCVARNNLLEQAEKLMNELASNKAILEIHYEDEVGTGLGPTLEFYALVSRELQRSDLGLFRGDPCPIPGAAREGSGDAEYVHSPVGLFPIPLGPTTRFSVVEEICSKFRFLGKLMAKAIMDSRMLDLPLSEAFYKWMLGTEGSFTAQDLQHVDPVVASSFAQLAAVAVKKHTLESDPLLTGKALAVGIESLTLEGGGTIEDLDIDFTLPGCPDLELKPGGKNLQVTIYNLDEYLKLVVEWTLVRGVARQMESFKEGFNSVFPLANMQGLFYPSEMDLLICGAHHQKWDIKELMECCRPDHGYSHDSRAVQFLFEVLSTYDTTEQRQFVQFVTGTPRLPVGGFKALNPPLTIVRKTVEQPQNPDNFLPSVMTCVNYLKLPDYSSVEIMRERLHLALMEGKHSFHLS